MSVSPSTQDDRGVVIRWGVRREPIIKRQGLIVPAVLALASFAPACGGKDVTTSPASTSEPTEPATGPTGGAPTTGTGTAGTSTGTTATGSTGSSSTTGGELPDCSLYNGDAETCLSMIACLYLDNEGACIVRCNNFTDQATCELQMFCYWAEGGCYLAV